jgi:hypothetical protein
MHLRPIRQTPALPSQLYFTLRAFVMVGAVIGATLLLIDAMIADRIAALKVRTPLASPPVSVLPLPVPVVLVNRPASPQRIPALAEFQVSQSSAWAGMAQYLGSNANLTDGSQATGAATEDHGPQWVAWEFADDGPMIDEIKLTAWAGYEGVLAGARLQRSDNGSTWIDFARLRGRAQEIFPVPADTKSRWWRVVHEGPVYLSEIEARRALPVD